MNNVRINKRESNIELLRIIAMLIIVMHHLVLHGQLLSQGVNFNNDLIIGGLLEPGGKIGFDIFIFISVYFSMGRTKFNSVKFLNLCIQVVFFNFIMILPAHFLGVKISLREVVGCVFPIFGNSHGFATAYLLFMILIPYLNISIKKLNKKNIQFGVLILFSMQVWSRILEKIINFERTVDVTNELIVFILIYLIAYYLKNYMELNLNRKVYICVFVCAWAINSIINILAVKTGNNLFISMLTLLNDEVSPINIIAAISAFYFFKGIRLKHNKIINIVAGRTFGILLFHDHNYIRNVIWSKVFKITMFYNAPLIMLVFYIIVVVILIFIIGIILDWIRENIVQKFMSKTLIYDRIINKLNLYIIIE